MNSDKWYQSRYARLTILTLVIGLMVYLLLEFILMLVNGDLPTNLVVIVALLAAGFLVTKFFSRSIG